MAETAAHLVDCVLPAVPTRQWVLSLPFPLRYRLAYDRTLATPLLAAFLRAVFASLRRRVRALYGVRFLELPPPDSQEVVRVLADAVKRLVSALERRSHGSDAEGDDEDDLSRDHPVMAALYAAAVQGRIAMGARAGQRVVRLGNALLATDAVDTGSSRCATLGGFSLHAGVAIGARDRAGLERVCRYMGRPPRGTRLPAITPATVANLVLARLGRQVEPEQDLPGK